MAHSLIVGMTESGKTTLATKLSLTYKQNNVGVIILDPLLDTRWAYDILTPDKAEFLSIVQHPQTRSCAIFVDESAEMIGQYEHEMFWLATRGRHYGHNCHFITQRAKLLNPTVRGQCSYLFLFNCSLTDAKELSDSWNREALRSANDLKKGEFFYCPRWGELKKLNVFKNLA